MKNRIDFLRTCWDRIKTKIQSVRKECPPFASEQDLECSEGCLNRAGMLNMAFKFVYGNLMEGDYFEFGCYSARTFRMAYRHSRKPYSRFDAQFKKKIHLWGFDSFEGFPEPKAIDVRSDWGKGDFNTSENEFHQILKKEGISDRDYTLVKGFYEKALTVDLQKQMKGVRAAVVFVDCDLYHSTKLVLNFLVPFLQQGTVICFDDYYLFSADKQKGEQRAIQEFLATHQDIEFVDWYQFGWHGKSFIVQMKSKS